MTASRTRDYMGSLNVIHMTLQRYAAIHVGIVPA